MYLSKDDRCAHVTVMPGSITDNIRVGEAVMYGSKGHNITAISHYILTMIKHS